MRMCTNPLEALRASGDHSNLSKKDVRLRASGRVQGDDPWLPTGAVMSTPGLKLKVLSLRPLA